jgi:uridine phosphorylase
LFYGKGFLNGITLSCPGFYGPQGRRVTLPISQEKFYDDLKTFHFKGSRITNFEMETAALYGMSKLMGHRCLSLNVLLANRATGDFSRDPNSSVDNLIRKSLEIIEAS